MGNFFTQVIILTPVILLALTVHEYAHGWVAYKFGDPTAKLAGRLTLNPLKHIDPLGLVMLYVIRIGWAKPVPVNPNYLRRREDIVFVALAGPVSNFLLAIGSAVLMKFIPSGFFPAAFAGSLRSLLYTMVFINLLLAFFNLLPIPPLDGWRIVTGFARPSYTLYNIERMGPIFILILILLPRLVGIDPLSIYLKGMLSFSSKILFGLFGV